MKIFRYIVLLFCVLVQNVGISETVEKTSSFLGRHFIVAFMQNEINRATTIETSFLSIFISSTQQDTVIISRQSKKDTLYLTPSEIREFILPNDIEVRNVGISSDKQIEITSSHPITCWVYSSINQSSDSYVAFPVGRWGREHRIISMPNDLYNGQRRQREDNAVDTNGNIIDPIKYAENLTPRPGEFLIMSYFDNTEIKYYPTANTINGVRRGDSATVLLNKGDVFLVQAVGGDIGTEDLTGTLIKSNNPVGVLSGHVRTAVSQGLDLPYDTKDHLVEMLPATNFWGRNFITIPFIDGQKPPELLCASGDLIKIVASEDSTKITYSVHKSDLAQNSNNFSFETHTAYINKAGEFFEFEADSPVMWVSDKPILVTQLMMHKGNVLPGKAESLNYDPSLVVIPPIEQYVESVTFSTPRNSKIFDQYKAHCVIVVADSISIENLYLDTYEVNQNTCSVWKKPIGDSDYYWAMLDIKNGNHKLVCKQGTFSGIIYGHGYRDSYSMTLGSKMADPDNPDTIAPKITLKDTCGNLYLDITDIVSHDKNATGIEHIYITKNTKNYDVLPFEVSDTATVIKIFAKPIDKFSDAFLEIEAQDKSYNKIKLQHRYVGFKVVAPSKCDFGPVNWISPTTKELELVNNSATVWTLQSIFLSNDSRLSVEAPVLLPYEMAPGESISIRVVFTPDGNNNIFSSQLVFNFNCDFKIYTDINGEVSAPGLLVDNLDFGKVRIGETKYLSGFLINAGNINIEVTDFVHINSESVFKWEYAPNIPIFLPVDSIIVYTAAFTPKENKQYNERTKVINDALIDAYFTTTGVGASPNIQDINLNFGKHRLGTSVDTVLYLYNTGDYADTVSYKQDVSITHDKDEALDVLHNIKNIIIGEQDSIKLNFRFSPIDTFSMQNKVELSSKWNLHKPIYANILGKGTLPAIKTINYDFGSVPIYSSNKINTAIIESIGNEALTIDSIIAISGDFDSFHIDYDLLKNILIEPDAYLDCAITFTPQFSGEHSLVLCVTHDANPSYARSTDTIYISGKALSDSEDYKFLLQLSQINACTTTNATLIIENHSTGKLIIDSINITRAPENFEAKFINNIDDLFPIEIEPGKSITQQIAIYAEKDKFGELLLTINYNGEAKKNLKAIIEPIAHDIISEVKFSKISLSPGDTVLLTLQSIIEHTSEKEFDFRVKLHLDKKIFYLLEKISYIDISIGATTKKVQVNLVQNDDFIEIQSENLALQNNIIYDKSVVKISIPFLVLLNLETETKISYSLESERCYNEGVAVLLVNIDKVCAHSLRQVQFGNFPMAQVSNNPASDMLDISINLPDKDLITLQIVDMSGKIYYEKSGIFMNSGKHNLIFNISDFPAAEYFVRLTGIQLNKTLKFVVVH